MKKLTLIALAILGLLALSGCANRPCLRGDYTQVKGHTKLSPDCPSVRGIQPWCPGEKR